MSKQKLTAIVLYSIGAIFLILIPIFIIIEKSNKPQNTQNSQNNPNIINLSTDTSIPAYNTVSPTPSGNQTTTSTQTGNATLTAQITCTEKIDKVPCKGWLVVTTKTNQEVVRKQSNEKGELTIAIAPGDYIIKGVSSSNYPVIVVQPEKVLLQENGSAKISINYWTGLR